MHLLINTSRNRIKNFDRMDAKLTSRSIEPERRISAGRRPKQVLFRPHTSAHTSATSHVPRSVIRTAGRASLGVTRWRQSATGGAEQVQRTAKNKEKVSPFARATRMTRFSVTVSPTRALCNETRHSCTCLIQLSHPGNATIITSP